MIGHLNQLLKKDSTNQWTQRETEAVKSLKAATDSLPTLQIPSHGNRILQTDASDHYWSAVLLEDIDGKRRLCGYKSEKFKQSESHYHSTFKKILAVKNEIQKFEFHLIGHHFIVESDMSVFSQMLNLKKKTIPNAQLLRWSQWFSQYSFTFRHIKGKENLIPDMLTRPPSHPQIIPVIAMMNPSSSSSSFVSPVNPSNSFLMDMEPNLPFDQLPPELLTLVTTDTLHLQAYPLLLKYQTRILRRYEDTSIQPIGIHLKYPFIHPFYFPIQH